MVNIAAGTYTLKVGGECPYCHGVLSRSGGPVWFLRRGNYWCAWPLAELEAMLAPAAGS